jgi:hypothetical protein
MALPYRENISENQRQTGGRVLMGRGQLACLIWALLTVSPAVAQQKAASSHPRPAPQVQGRFIDADGNQITLHYVRGSQPQAFVGTVQATCILPARSKSGESKPLKLSAIPAGTQMTVYYLRHTVGKNAENVIMALRFDQLQPGSDFPQGVYIPCFKGPETSVPK